MTLDDLEFELRKLPGVRAAGFDDRGDVLMVQLHLAPEGGHGEELELPMPVAATRIAARHSDKPVAVEVVRWRQAPAPTTEPVAVGAQATVTPISPAIGSDAGPAATAGSVATIPDTAAAEPERGVRPRLLAVLSFPDTDEVEVHLVLHGRRTIGRAAASGGLVAVVAATLEAIRGFGVELTVRPMWARPVEGDEPEHILVAVGIDVDDDDRQLFGLSGGTSAIDAGARATLDALNRHLARSVAATR